jgi:hypothetical protein
MLAGILQPVSGAPYQGQKISRSVQTLSDGTVITHETRVRTDPDAALFQVPPGYTIRDLAQILKTFSDLGKPKTQ